MSQLEFSLEAEISQRHLSFLESGRSVPSRDMLLHLAERLEGFPIRLSQLAHGLPVGGELDYLDEGTLAQALRARRPIG